MRTVHFYFPRESLGRLGETIVAEVLNQRTARERKRLFKKVTGALELGGFVAQDRILGIYLGVNKDGRESLIVSAIEKE